MDISLKTRHIWEKIPNDLHCLDVLLLMNVGINRWPSIDKPVMKKKKKTKWKIIFLILFIDSWNIYLCKILPYSMSEIKLVSFLKTESWLYVSHQSFKNKERPVKFCKYGISPVLKRCSGFRGFKDNWAGKEKKEFHC